MQAAQTQLQVSLDTSAKEHDASSATWEKRLQDAITSAEKWQAFAGGLDADKGKLENEAGQHMLELQVLPPPLLG